MSGDVDTQIAELKQLLQALRLTVDRLDRELTALSTLVYGDQRAGQPGVVSRLTTIETKIDRLADEWDGVKQQIRGARLALFAVAAVGGADILKLLAQLAGIIP